MNCNQCAAPGGLRMVGGLHMWGDRGPRAVLYLQVHFDVNQNHSKKTTINKTAGQEERRGAFTCQRLGTPYPSSTHQIYRLYFYRLLPKALRTTA